MPGRSRTARGALLPLALLLATTVQARGGSPTLGVLAATPDTSTGYSLFDPLRGSITYLIDNQGRVVHSWDHGRPTGNMAYLLDDGNLLRGVVLAATDFGAPGQAGLLQELDWDGNVLWEFQYADSTILHHHDLARLPNGNVLLIAWERKSAAEAIAAGRDPALLPDGEVWPEHIVEVEPAGAGGGNIVWEWHVWDHLIQDHDPTKNNFGVVANHPERIDPNFTPDGTADWLHANAIAYHPGFDQIVISVNRFREFWIIDHSTTTEEAAGHTGGLRGRGGDLLYRWGNPQAYDRGTDGDQRLFFQHHPHWIEPGLPGEGHILVFNNGSLRPAGAFSTVDEVVTPVSAGGDYPALAAGVPHGPGFAAWTYTANPPESLYAPFISGAQRLPNGNTLVCDGPGGTFLEVDPAGSVVWHYVNPANSAGPMTQGDEPALNEVFRVHRYAPDHPAFAGRDLTPGDPIELPSTPVRLSALAARPLPDRAAVEVTWSTAVEVRHEGFHVERGPTPGGPWELRTSSLIRGRSPYRWVDEAVPTGTPWYYRVVAIDTDGRAEPHGPVAVTVPARPMVTRLRGVRPNPAPGRTAVSFVLARAGPVELAVYDVRGRLVRHLARGPLPAGEHSVDWNGDTEHGARAPAGIYFVRLTSTGTADVRSIVRTDPD